MKKRAKGKMERIKEGFIWQIERNIGIVPIRLYYPRRKNQEENNESRI